VLEKNELLNKDDQMEEYLDEGRQILIKAEAQLQKVNLILSPITAPFKRVDFPLTTSTIQHLPIDKTFRRAESNNN
jgi:hypothetical protein